MDKRNGDTITIAGDYQYKAITEGYRVQRFWHQAKLLAIRKFLPPESGDLVLDIGCGSGVISSFLGENGANVVGIDANPEAVQFAAERYASEQVKFVNAPVDDVMPVDRVVDKIYCLELIEHIHLSQAGKMLDMFHRSLKDGGKVFLSTPNSRSLWPVIEWLLDHSGLVPQMGGHQHVEFYHREKLASLCRAHGFIVNEIATICFLSPWLAAISRRAAERMFYWETSDSFFPGPILIAVLEKH